MTIAEAFTVAQKSEDEKTINEIALGFDERTNEGYKNMILSALAMGGIETPGVLLFMLSASFHAGTIYGEAKGEASCRAEFTNPFKELGQFSKSFQEHEH